MGTSIDRRVVWLAARPRLRQHGRALAVVTVLVALVGGLVSATASASRRAGTSFDRLMVAAGVSEIDVEGFEEIEPGLVEEIGAIEGVDGVSLIGFVAVIPQGQGIPFVDGITFAALEGNGTPVNDGLIVEGRAVDDEAPDEVVLNRPMAERTGLGVGDRITLDALDEGGALRALDGEQNLSLFSLEATIVGITTGAEDVADPSDPYLVASAALATGAGAASFPGMMGLRVDDRRLSAVIQAVEALMPDAEVRPASDLRSRIADGIDVQAMGLAAFAAVAAVVGLFAVAQVVRRTMSAARSEDDVLGAIGVTHLERQAAALTVVAPVVLAGTTAAVVGGILAAPHAITGLAAQAEPDGGMWFDVPAIVLTVTALSLVVLIPAGRARGGSPAVASATDPGVVERAIAGARLPLFLAMGARRALGLQARRWSGRAAVAAAAAAVVGVVAVVTLDGSIDRLFRTPADWGVAFDLFVDAGPNPSAAVETVGDRLTEDPTIESVSVVGDTTATVRRPDDVPLSASVIWASPLKSSADPWRIVDGTALRGDGEALVGPGLLADLGLAVGDRLQLTTADGDHALQVVGAAIAYGLERVDRSIIVTPDGAAQIGAESEDLGMVVTFADGTDVERERERLDDALMGVEEPGPPAAVDNLDELGLMPLALALTVSLLGLTAVGHALTASVRRSRREVACLRALGATGRQLRSTVISHALAIAVIGLGAGLPLGLALGRVVYIDTAEGVGVLAHAATPGWTITMVSGGAVAVALLAAALPALRITALRAGTALREQ